MSKTITFSGQELIFLVIIFVGNIQLSVIGACYRGLCYSILMKGSKECYSSLESGLKVSILGKGDKNAG